MNDDLIKRLAEQAGIDIEQDTLCRYEGWEGPMRTFAALVAEECAKIAESFPEEFGQYHAKAIREAFSSLNLPQQ